MTKRNVLVGLVILDAVLVNGLVAYFLYKSQDTLRESPGQAISNEQFPITKIIDQCGDECKKYIDQRIASFSALKPTAGAPAGPSAAPKVVYVQQAGKTAKVKTTSYVTTPGNGSTSENEWADLGGTEFYFNPADYPGLVEVYFEVNMKLFNGNGMAYVRLFDVTHGVGVQGSDVQTNNQTDGLVVSGKVTFWSGKNLIRVQAKSLTADTAIFTSGRLRIVTEN